MIVPQYWAEARVTHRDAGRRITIRRVGWSDASEADALQHAQARADAALKRALAGEREPRREPKIPYNGAQGVPIREEVLERHGETVITRNAYGAQCLNTPSVVFADVDVATTPRLRVIFSVFGALLLLAIGAGVVCESMLLGSVAALVAAIGAAPLARVAYHLRERIAGGGEARAVRRIERFAVRHPDWALNLYRTPAGLRVLVTHRPFTARDPGIADFFAQIGADPIYVRMCLNQNCFRARLTAKPWRIGISAHLRPRPGVWPVAPARLPLRTAWVTAYEQQAREFAACRWLRTFGPKVVHPAISAVLELHDSRSGAYSTHPLA